MYLHFWYSWLSYILCLFWITILFKYIFIICDCNHNIIYHSLPTNKHFSVFWDKLKHPHNIAFITFLHTLRHYIMPQEYQPLATLLNMANFSIGTLNYLHIATMWHYIYLLLLTYFVEQINFAYFVNAKYFRPPLIKALVKNMTIKSSLFKFSKECCYFLFIFIYFIIVLATSVLPVFNMKAQIASYVSALGQQPVFDMKAQLALYVSVLGHKITFDSNTALHILICQQHSYYKLTRGAVLNFYIASSYSYYFILFAHETLFIFTVTDMLNLRFSLKIYIFKFMIINFYHVSLRIAQKILSYIIYVRFIGHIWTVTGLNIIMQKLATFAYAQVTCHTIAIYSIIAQHESIYEPYPNISLQGDQY